MQKDMDAIQFESRHEIEEVMSFLSQHLEESSAIQELYDLLDAMYIEW